MTHHLKTWPKFYRAVKSGRKTFELRKDNRGFKVGDILILECWNPKTGKYSVGRSVNPIKRRITYIMKGGLFGLEFGYVVMGIEPVI